MKSKKMRKLRKTKICGGGTIKSITLVVDGR
jgi:hypothetical protein